jgi:hypothetical protein
MTGDSDAKRNRGDDKIEYSSENKLYILQCEIMVD